MSSTAAPRPPNAVNPVKREQLRLSLLRFLDANQTRYALPSALLLTLARGEGRQGLAQDECETELRYLQDKGLVESIHKLVSPENLAWRITASGRDFLAGQGG